MEAFGFPAARQRPPAAIDQPRMIWLGAFEDGLLVAGWSIMNSTHAGAYVRSRRGSLLRPNT
jgi:hypothetical protein